MVESQVFVKIPGFFLLLLMVLSACQTAVPTAIPTVTPTPVATRTPFVMPTALPTDTPAHVTPTLTPISIDSFVGQGYQPPLAITLPENWTTQYDTALAPQLGDLEPISVVIYKGPVTGGTGTIALVWNFRSVTTGNPFDPQYGQVNLWIDGLRLLRSLVMEVGCNIGTAPQRNDFKIGTLPATGTDWSAVDCPYELPDTRGWFAGVEVEGVSFIFYTFTDPIEAMDGPAAAEMQAILDSVEFKLDELPTATPGG